VTTVEADRLREERRRLQADLAAGMVATRDIRSTSARIRRIDDQLRRQGEKSW
jgi:hypothetical protein